MGSFGEVQVSSWASVKSYSRVGEPPFVQSTLTGNSSSVSTPEPVRFTSCLLTVKATRRSAKEFETVSFLPVPVTATGPSAE